MLPDASGSLCTDQPPPLHSPFLRGVGSVHRLQPRGLWKAFLRHSRTQRPQQGIRMSLVWIINFKCGRFEFWGVSHVSVFNSSSCLLSPLHRVWYRHFKAMLLVGILPQQGLIVWLNLFFYLPTLFKTFLRSQSSASSSCITINNTVSFKKNKTRNNLEAQQCKIHFACFNPQSLRAKYEYLL